MAGGLTREAPVREAREHGERAAGSDSLEWLARAGLVARGFVYGVIAVLALGLALGAGGKTTDQQGALHMIAKESYGKVLLVLLAIGLAGYAIWRIVRAIVGHGPESGEDDWKDRVAGIASGISYGLLCVTAVEILAGSGGGGSNADKTTGGVLGWPGGQVLVIIAGLIIVGVGLEQVYEGVKHKFCEKSKTEQMSEQMRRFFKGTGTFGYVARGVVFVLIGFFVTRAAIEFDPDKAVGLDGALSKLAHSAGGPYLLGLVAFGLLGFALYSALDARYRKV
jgi:Domain of Unknown Function (DUF1206)